MHSGKVVTFCFKMNCICKLMLNSYVEFLVSSERVENFAPAEASQPALGAGPRIVFILDKMSM